MSMRIRSLSTRAGFLPGLFLAGLSLLNTTEVASGACCPCPPFLPSCGCVETCNSLKPEDLTCVDMMNDINWSAVRPGVPAPGTAEKDQLCAATALDPNGWLIALFNYHRQGSNKLNMPPLPGGTCSDFRRALQTQPKADPNHLTDPNFDTRILEDRNRWSTVPRYFDWATDYWGSKPEKTKRMEFLGTLERGFTYSRLSCDSACDPNVACGRRDAFVSDWIELVRRFDATREPKSFQDCPSNGEGDVLAASTRASHLVHGHRAFVQDADTPAFDAIANRDILLAAFRHGTFLSDTDTDKTDSNQGVSSMTALFLTGYYFNEFNSSSCWRQRAVPRVDTHSRAEFQDDGTPSEGALGYHVRNVRNLLAAVWIYRNNSLLNPAVSVTFQCAESDLPCPPHTGPCCPPTNIPTKLQRGAQVIAELSQPDHFIATIGDGAVSEATTAIVCDAARVYDKPTWAYIALDGDTGDTSCTDPNSPASPQMPTSTSSFFSSGQILKFRSPWTVQDPNGPGQVFDKSARQLLLYAVQNAQGTHDHHDSLSLDLFGFGRHMIVDPGAYRLGEPDWDDNCSNSPCAGCSKACYEDLHWFINSENSHSKITVLNQENCGDHNQSVDDKALRDLFDYARISADIGDTCAPPATGKRYVLFVKPDWIFVSDLADGLCMHDNNDVLQNYLLGPTPQDPNHSAARPAQNCNLMRYSSIREHALPSPCFAVIDPNGCPESSVSIVPVSSNMQYIDDPGINLRVYSMSQNTSIELKTENDPSLSARPNAVFPVPGAVVRGRKAVIDKPNPSGSKAAIHTLLAMFPENAPPNMTGYRQTVKSSGTIQGETTAFGARLAEAGKLDRRYFIDFGTPPDARKYYETSDTESWTFRGRVTYFQIDMSTITPFSDTRIHSARKLIWREGLSGQFIAYQSDSAVDLDIEAKDGILRVNKDGGGSVGNYRVFAPNTAHVYENGLEISPSPPTSGWRLCNGKCVIKPDPGTCPSSTSGC